MVTRLIHLWHIQPCIFEPVSSEEWKMEDFYELAAVYVTLCNLFHIQYSIAKIYTRMRTWRCFWTCCIPSAVNGLLIISKAEVKRVFQFKVPHKCGPQHWFEGFAAFFLKAVRILEFSLLTHLKSVFLTVPRLRLHSTAKVLYWNSFNAPPKTHFYNFFLPLQYISFEFSQ